MKHRAFSANPFLVLGTATCLALAIIAPSSAQQEPAARPILYLDSEESAGSRPPLIRGIYPDGRQLGTLVQGVGAAWSPDGAWFAYLEGDTALKLMNLSKTVQTAFSTTDAEPILRIWGPAWSPDGRSIAVILRSKGESSDYWVAVIDVDGHKVLSRHRLPAGIFQLPYPLMEVDKFSWSPTGRKILVSWESAVVIDTVTGAIETISKKPIASEWTPSGDAIYFVDKSSRLGPPPWELGDFFFKKLGAQEPVKLADKKDLVTLGLTMNYYIPWTMILSPSGSKLAIAGGLAKQGTGGKAEIIGRLHIYEMKSGKMLAVGKPAKSYQTDDILLALEWAPSEDSVAVIAFSESEKLVLRVLDPTTGSWRTLATVHVPTLEVFGFIKTLSWAQ